MTVSAALIDLAAKLVDVETRTEAASEIAHELGADSLILFMRDQTHDSFEPLAGCRQIVTPHDAQRSFFQQCVRKHRHAGELEIFDKSSPQPVYGISKSPDLVLLLVGDVRPSESIDTLERLLPLIAQAVRGAQGAEKANEAKSEFLTTMSHELRTPLNAIGGYVQLLQLGVHGPLSEAQVDALDRVHSSQQHLLRLINDILSLARIEAGGVKYNIVNVDLNEVARNVLAIAEVQAGDKPLGFVLEVPDREISARADREKLDHVLLSLLSNAIKFTPAGGTITVRARYHPHNAERAIIEVSDTGHGIMTDKLDHIFNAFVQLHTGLTRAHEGTGLGLAISRDLTRGMNGDLKVSSEIDRGSTFTVELPVSTVLRSASTRRMAARHA